MSEREEGQREEEKHKRMVGQEEEGRYHVITCLSVVKHIHLQVKGSGERDGKSPPIDVSLSAASLIKT